ncbi:MAG: hypothetical protein LBJ14_09945 [Desulfarculales bacterium]|jgi:hypothetical protein|nr:hypothetical protein [Desulfarculales bacterium]
MLNAEKKNLSIILNKFKQDARYLQSKPRGVERRQKHEALACDLSVLRRQPGFQRLIVDEYPAVSALEDAFNREQWDELIRFSDYSQTKLRQDPVQYKAVFFPYLAATWDALESVYEAFAQDARFITDIVIIPTYRESPAGTVNLYEKFLPDLPNTPYAEYDIAADKPDIVFVSNPYDLITIPRFRSAHIRQHCAMLVYVPYYGILGGTSAHRHYSFDQPIYQLADKVIVQSQLMAEACRQYFPKAGKNLFLPLGAPKLDSFKKETALAGQAPNPEWQERIKGRCLFLLDTHYNLPNWERNLPDKRYNRLNLLTESILSHFRQRQDIFLLWRPHPLTEHILTNYTDFPSVTEMNTLLKQAASMPNCIIDKDKTAAAAVACSQALISLGHSLKHIYVSSGKAVIYHLYNEQSLGLLEDEKLLIPDNELYYVPLARKISYVLRLRLHRGNPEADKQLQTEENSLLAALSEELRFLYESIVNKYAQRETFGSAFQAAIKNIAPHPVLGYRQAARKFVFSQTMPTVILPLAEEVREDLDCFEYALYKDHEIKEVLNYIDMLAAGQDPLREKRLALYSQVLANSDKNIGRIIHEKIAGEFLALKNNQPAFSGKDRPGAHKKKEKQRGHFFAGGQRM